jgi:predicted Zn-dependent protease
VDRGASEYDIARRLLQRDQRGRNRPPPMNRPVMTEAQVTRLSQTILAMTSADTVAIRLMHTARIITRVANDEVFAGDDGDELELGIYTRYGGRIGVKVETNQLTESTLRALVAQCETLARAQFGTADEVRHVRQDQDVYIPIALWHESTVQGMTTSRESIVPGLIEGVTRHGLRAAGFVGLMARAQAILTKEGVFAFGEETDSEVTMTARSPDGKSSGWAGQAARDWSRMDYGAVAEQAAQLALQSCGAQALEPGRRTAILGPAAVSQLLRYLAPQFDAFDTDMGRTGFSKTERGGNKLRQRVFDSRIQMHSDPADLEGGYLNYFGNGFANPKMTWVDKGVLMNLAYDPFYAMGKGKPYAEVPSSLHMAGGPSSIEAMIAQCADGIYVNRLSSVDMLDKRTGMMTGVTRDGCFFVKDGKIEKPVKNFRILESPFFFLNKLMALGPTARAPFGYTPPGRLEGNRTWPRSPIIVPPLMVQDFNFSALADAV